MQPSTSGLTVWATEVIWTLDSGERKFSWISPPHWSRYYLFRNWFHDQYRKAANDREKTWNMLGAMVPVLVGNVSFAKSKWKTCSLGVYMNQIDSTVNTNKNLMKINEVKKKNACPNVNAKHVPSTPFATNIYMQEPLSVGFQKV